MGSARRDDDAFSSERIRGTEFAHNGIGDLRDLGQAPFIHVAACEVSPTGPYDANAARAYRADILLRRGGFPHVHIHRGRNDDGPRCSEKRCRHEVVGDSVGHLGDDVRRCGRYDDAISLFGERDMVDGVRGVIEEPDGNFLMGQSSEGGGSYELRGMLGHEHLNPCALLLEDAYELACFVGGDAAGNTD